MKTFFIFLILFSSCASYATQGDILMGEGSTDSILAAAEKTNDLGLGAIQPSRVNFVEGSGEYRINILIDGRLIGSLLLYATEVRTPILRAINLKLALAETNNKRIKVNGQSTLGVQMLSSANSLSQVFVIVD